MVADHLVVPITSRSSCAGRRRRSTSPTESTPCRRRLGERGLPVMDAEVRLREAYPAAFGTAPRDLGEYAAVPGELRTGSAQDGAT
jgi:hypothetical protein